MTTMSEKRTVGEAKVEVRLRQEQKIRLISLDFCYVLLH